MGKREAKPKRLGCVIDGKPCAKHGGAVHGREAEELRQAIELLVTDECCSRVDILRALERVDARDSLAYLESRD